MIGLSLINVESGGRLSGAFAACCLLAFVLFLSLWIEMIPMAALVGVMFMVAIGTFEWASLRLYRKVPLTDFNDPESVVIDFYYTRVYDHSGMEAIHSIAAKYQQLGKTVHLTHLSEECRMMIRKAADLVCVSFSDEPQFHVSTDQRDQQAQRAADALLTDSSQ